MAKPSKNLKKLSRADLLELLVDHSREIERLKGVIAGSKETCADLRVRYDELKARNAELEQERLSVESVVDEAVRLFMESSNQIVEKIVSENQTRADTIVSDALLEAETIVKNAEEEAAIVRRYSRMMLVDALEKAASVEAAAQSASDQLMAETQRNCLDLRNQVKAEIDAMFDEADARALRRWRR